MCLAKDNDSPKSEPASPKSPWAKLLNKQNLKPRLPRKISTKVNLNKYWSKLGELVSAKSEADPKLLVLPFSDYFYPVDPVKIPSDVHVNETNQKISHGKRFELIPSNCVEIDENLANEVREICLNNHDCFYCKICA